MTLFPLSSSDSPSDAPSKAIAAVGGKSADNPPLVTVIGGGIAGLTAAHELMERGFSVQVVEKDASREYPGEVSVGGMARSQWGRIKASLRDLHPALVEALDKPEDKKNDPFPKDLAELLRRILLYTRSPYVETEPALEADLTLTFAAGVPRLDAAALHTANLAVRLFGSVGKISRLALQKQLSGPNSPEPAIAFLTGAAILRDYPWRQREKSLFREFVNTALYREMDDADCDMWAKGAASGDIESTLVQFDAHPGCSASSLEKVDAALTKALVTRVFRFVFNLTDCRSQLRRKTRREFCDARCDSADFETTATLREALRLIKGKSDEADAAKRHIRSMLETHLKQGASTSSAQVSAADSQNNQAQERSKDAQEQPYLAEEDVSKLLAEIGTLTNGGDDPVGQALCSLVTAIAKTLCTQKRTQDADLLTANLAKVVEVFRREILHIELRGYASSEGDLNNNTAVAAARAAATYDELKKLDGAKLWLPHIAKVTRGEENPVASNANWVGRSRNRRATLVAIERVVPGEHGFRFFPRHYKNLFALLRRIPLLDDQGRETQFTVHDNLLTTTQQALGMQDPDLCRAKAKRSSAPAPKGAPEAKKHDFEVTLQRTLPRSLHDLRAGIVEFLDGTGATFDDATKFQLRALRYLTSGSLRRWNEYEDLPWSKFVGLEPCAPGDDPEQCVPPDWQYSPAMQVQLRAAAQALLAYAVNEADTHSYGNFSMQTIVDQMDPDRRVDLILNGPTSLAWIDPWKRWLHTQGVRFFSGTLCGLRKHDEELLPAFTAEPVPERGHAAEDDKYKGTHYAGSDTQPVTSGSQASDFYVLATPLYPTGTFIENSQEEGERDFDATVAFLNTAKADPQTGVTAFRDMSGLQFHFERSVKWGEAHTYFPESWWGISAITQTARWRIRARTEGGFLGLVSVDISDWRSGRGFARPVPFGRQPIEIAVGVHQQIEWGSELVVSTRNVGTDDERLAIPDYFHIDEGLERSPYRLPSDCITKNNTKYLANLAGQFILRPGLHTTDGGNSDGATRTKRWCTYKVDYEVAYKRWVIAGAHMATHTRMMTMEGSAESGMHATNAILEALNNDDPNNPIYNGVRRNQPIQPTEPMNLEDDEIADLGFLKQLDDRLFRAGLPHLFTMLQAERMLLAHQKLTAAAAMTAEAGRELARVHDSRESLPDRFKSLIDEVTKLVDEHIGPFDPAGVLTGHRDSVGQLRRVLEGLRDFIIGRKPDSKPAASDSGDQQSS